MKRALIGLLLAFCLVAFSRPATAELRQVDCESPADWFVHNAKSVLSIVSIGFRWFSGEIGADVPNYETSWQRLLFQMNLVGSEFHLGVSPQNAWNSVLGLACLEYVVGEDVPPGPVNINSGF